MTPRQTSYLVKRFEDKEKREDHRAGEIVAMLFNINRDTEKMPDGIDWTDVFPRWKDPVSEQTEEDMFNVMQQFAVSRMAEA